MTNQFKVSNLFRGVIGVDEKTQDMLGQLDALYQHQAVIQFSLDGTILEANTNFLNALGYQLNEIQGRHHRIFVDPEEAKTREYADFWAILNSGQPHTGEFRRITKSGDDIWIQATYAPIKDANGRTVRVVKFATDITASKKQQLAEDERAERAAAENSRIKSALDSCQGNIMIADNDYNIIYMNETMDQMMRSNETALRTELPQFNASALIGANIDIFHKNPAHQRTMLEAMTQPHKTQITVGGRTFSLIASPVRDDAGSRIGTCVEWADITEKLAAEDAMRKEAAANARVKSALDMCTTNVMVANADREVIYMNQSVTRMLKNAEQDIQKELPNFATDKVVGSTIDIFHQNPDHQKAMLERMKQTHKTEIKVGVRKFGLIANPVFDEDGERLGTVVEWQDVTQERAIEGELDQVVTAIAAGDFSSRLDVAGKEGFMLNMAEGINAIATTCEQGLTDIAASLKALADGDLTHQIDNDYQGMFDELKQDANATSQRLADTVSSIAQASGEVSSAAEEITAGSTDLAERTESQASALEETAAAMEQMAATVKTNSENAQSANQLGQEARKVATEGGQVVDRAVTAMAAIEDSSQKISDIIGVIDEIAFQTNLLALNAAVEAARAGDAGRGFAVVASEVRTLAGRSADAAKDIKSLILDSGTQVKQGVELVGETGETLKNILDSIKNVTEIVSEIAAASEEQATGIDEINTSVTEMDNMTQQNSALVEENAAAARELESQANTMRDEMQFFTVSDDGTKKLSKPAARKVLAAPKAKAAKAKPAAKKKTSAKKAAPSLPAPSADDEDWSEF